MEKVLLPPAPLDTAYEPSVQIAKIPASASVEEIIKILDRDGGVILTDLLSLEQLASIEEETKDYYGDGAIAHEGIVVIPKETTIVCGLVGKSNTMAELCEHPHLVELRKRILTDVGFGVQEDRVYPYHIDPLLSISMSFRVKYGAPRQRLHRDDMIHLVDHSKPFQIEKASQFAILVAGCETTRANGGTMFVPGSHRWDEKRKPQLDEVTFTEMKPGSALIFMAGAYHGAGYNSIPGSTRVLHGLFFCRGTYRTEENQFLAIPRSKLLSMSPTMQALLGYKQPSLPLGTYEGSDPMRDLDATLLVSGA